MNVDTLIQNIEECRNHMIQLAKDTSLSDKEVIRASTKLDHLLNTYYHITSEKSYS
ncbi:aspartyl-phosphate phosphatase Spo0E family protein [Mesobacillus campisalis]|jgi:hypothetical protein|uniref:aspartyl-phosphate phosphatase Spo0E family protein n=1 Tax=Mesobacillus campisalis TaxID=1408103 RepID=UPI000A07D6B1|nr:aspartyl-phosphate phosphatase Spo0E family protein [Mesobacillus campisalis]